ncbi:MAG: hypothetical protein EI684_09630 [Candidatus Viridilinea halotolerans]|uniref:Uncharacterized protein n=1 Tax=Candidatus Viridilinea halotolerans TaxID=2491704 RepID=A0A426U0X0_9CHLR|nr:MAG: hypothetical protein EI684_09630 [Candidatus Viridilinea halotolerans]
MRRRLGATRPRQRRWGCAPNPLLSFVLAASPPKRKKESSSGEASPPPNPHRKYLLTFPPA